MFTLTNIILLYYAYILFKFDQKLLQLLYYCLNKYKPNCINIILYQSEYESNELLLDTLKVINFMNECI